MIKRSYLTLCLILSLFAFGCSRGPVFTPEETHLIQERPSPPRKGKDGFPLVVIDPGHGGKDLGTHSFNAPRYEEKAVTLATAYFLQNYLREMGFRTVMTRHDDRFVALQDRATVANTLQADLFVSLHYNSAEREEAEGIEVFYFPSEKDHQRSEKSKKLAASVLKEVIRETKAKSRGVKKENFAVIRETKMPAILVEGGFLTHPLERERLLQRSYLRKIAFGVAQGINNYLKMR